MAYTDKQYTVHKITNVRKPRLSLYESVCLLSVLSGFMLGRIYEFFVGTNRTVCNKRAHVLDGRLHCGLMLMYPEIKEIERASGNIMHLSKSSRREGGEGGGGGA